MAQKTTNFDDKKINENIFYKNKNYLVCMILMLIKYSFQKRNLMAK